MGNDSFKSKTKKRILLILTVAILITFYIGSEALVINPEFDKLSDAMKPEYMTWKNSVHSQLKCTDCHTLSAIDSISILLNSDQAPITGNEISSDKCKSCHSSYRQYSLPGDLIVPHAKHENKGIACVQCHSGTAHGNIKSRNVIDSQNKASRAKWTLADGKNNMKAAYSEPKMDTCINCHRSKNLSFKCELCHKGIFTPVDHKDKKSWAQNHGIIAEQNINYCIKCHSYGAKVDISVKTGNAIINYAWGNDFCTGCHSKKPANHKDRDEWMPAHKQVISKKGMKNCHACHAIKEEESSISPVPSVYCNRCHWF